LANIADLTTMDIISFILTAFAIFTIVITLVPFLRWDYWWVRVFDFPRIQIASLQFAVLTLWFVIAGWHWDAHIIQLILVLSCFVYQIFKIFKYTPFAKPEVMRNKNRSEENDIAILVSNVLAPNRNAGPLLDLISQKSPDIILTLESDAWWGSELKCLQTDYPHFIEIPLDNLYGMHLYSKLELSDCQVKYLISEEVPSIHSSVRLRSGKIISIHCLHPKPPGPSEGGKSTNRDAELLLVAKSIENSSEKVLVFGDLNDVAWSRTTRLFQKISGLLDPRVGRGFFNTYNANWFMMRWPLDHIFHSNDFTLNEIRKLPHIGSDHFPIYANLHYSNNAKKRQEKHEADQEESDWADEKIKKAL